MLGLYNFPVGTFESTKIKVFMNSLQINLNNFPINMSQTTIVDMKILTDIVQICDSMYMGPIFFFFKLTSKKWKHSLTNRKKKKNNL